MCFFRRLTLLAGWLFCMLPDCWAELIIGGDIALTAVPEDGLSRYQIALRKFTDELIGKAG